MKWIEPDWPAPAKVRALSTTRDGGISEGSLPASTWGPRGDEPARVEANRTRLQQAAGIPGTLNWLNQVHGTAVHPVSRDYGCAPDADAACAREAGQACIVMTADCLPVLFCDRAGTVVAAAHAGWRGLQGAYWRRASPPWAASRARSWPGWVRPSAPLHLKWVARCARPLWPSRPRRRAFVPSPNEGKWLADIYQLARLRLTRAGVTAVYGGEHCTFSDSEQFYSYRRDGQTGRMASLIWLVR